MAFPVSPTNGQIATVNDVDYIYNSTVRSWTRTPSTDITVKNLTVSGNLAVQGNTTTLDVETLTVEDLNITLANGAVSAGSADGAGLTVAGADARLVYKSATDAWVLNKAVFASGNLVANSGTVSNSTTTGALVVAGGAGISGNLYVGSTANQSIFLNSYPEWAANSARQTAKWTTSTTTPVNSILGDSWYDSSTDILYEYINDGTNSVWVDVSSAFGNNFVTVTGETVRATGGTSSTSTATGALRVTGGAGITGNVYVGEHIVSSVAGGFGSSGSRFTANTSTKADFHIASSVNGASATATQQYGITFAPSSGLTQAAILIAENGSDGTGIGFFCTNSYGAGPQLRAFISPTGDFTPGANIAYNLGSATGWWNTVYGKAVQAQYADLAENYTADDYYQPGTVVVFGGEKEITTTTISHDPCVAGVISTEPAYLMNAATAGLPVALSGRVPCFVKGPISKGDLVVASEISGVAIKLDKNKFEHGCLIGKSLVDIKTDLIECVEIVVGRY